MQVSVLHESRRITQFECPILSENVSLARARDSFTLPKVTRPCYNCRVLTTLLLQRQPSLVPLTLRCLAKRPSGFSAL